MRKTAKKKADYSFSREDTKIVKGLAIALMLAHHIFLFPERMAGGQLWYHFNLFGESSLTFIGGFGKICVSLFFFLGGYGIYLQSKKRNFSILENIKKLFLAYWKVFIIFIPIAFLFFRSQSHYCDDPAIYARFSSFRWEEIIKNFLGVSASLNGEWWFLFSYLVAIASFPLWKHIFSRVSAYKGVIIVVFTSLLVSYVLPAIGNMSELGNLNSSYLFDRILMQPNEYFACFLVGMLFAQYDWMTKIRKKISEHFKVNAITGLLALAAIMFLRQKVSGPSLDILYAPAVCIALVAVTSKIHFMARFLGSLGKYSTTMWLTHSFYCYYFYAIVQIVVWPRWGILSFVILLAISYTTAFLLDNGWRIGINACKKISAKK